MQQALINNLRSVMENTGLRSALENAGVDIRRTSVRTSQSLRNRLLFEKLDIDLVIDVGANFGQFAGRCRALGYKGEIISFEPLSSAYATLLQRAATDPLWTIAERMAIGDALGEVEINIAGNSASSSILPMLDSHIAAEPTSQYIQKEKVSLRRLDDVLGDTKAGRRTLLKLDVQGFETQVLAGAANFLTSVTAVQLEMSLIPLYQGETLMLDICSQMDRMGFHLWDMDSSLRDPDTGRLLQVDGTFTRKSLDDELQPHASH
jgi:FkbM family methyltransferase